MGRYVNPGNVGFQVALNSTYVDKTGLLEYTNSVMGTKSAWICNSRPRRFGKSTTVDMLVAYYSKGCDSSELFDDLFIGKSRDYREHLNKHDVIRFDVQGFTRPAIENNRDIVKFIEQSVIDELQIEFPEVDLINETNLAESLAKIYFQIGTRFVIVIDEWDAIIRDEQFNKKQKEDYIGFLRDMFKGSDPTEYVLLAFLTGILPVKRELSQSSLNNFDEFTMLNPFVLAPYIGFTEEEVNDLCEKNQVSFEKMKQWYDGYTLGGLHVYNPNSVIKAVKNRSFQSYWSGTGSYVAIVPLINMNFDGLKDAVLTMLAGGCVEVNTTSYQNDMISFADRDDVLTALIHLGYLAYDGETHLAFIPNDELQQEFRNAVIKQSKWEEFARFYSRSEKLLEATLAGEEDTVAKYIEEIHEKHTSILQYNDENSLSCVIAIAFLSSMNYYFTPRREIPAGKGYADLIYVPRYQGSYPALIVELKWNQSVETAIDQIKRKNYVQALDGWEGSILLVGVNYDPRSKKHACKIERVEKENEESDKVDKMSLF